MSFSIGFIIDPPALLNLAHDSTLAMIMAAHRAGISVAVMEIQDLLVQDAHAFALVSWLNPSASYDHWYNVRQKEMIDLCHFDCVMMRKDPPCDAAFFHATHILSLAKSKGARVINDPDSLRLFHEKWMIEYFGDIIAPTLVSTQHDQLKKFIRQYQHIVLKPLDGMGGRGIFQVRDGDPNIPSLLETLQRSQGPWIMAQQYLSAIQQGDKRILILNGEAFPYALARIPEGDDFRGNLAVGGRGVAVPLSEHDRYLVSRVAPFLLEHGVCFVGLDVIGNFITEINITSPTCIRELDEACSSDIAGMLIKKLIV